MYIRPTRSSPRNNSKTRLRQISEIIGVPAQAVLSYVRQLKLRTGEKIPATIQIDRRIDQRVAGRQVGLWRLPLTLPVSTDVNEAFHKWQCANRGEKSSSEQDMYFAALRYARAVLWDTSRECAP